MNERPCSALPAPRYLLRVTCSAASAYFGSSGIASAASSASAEIGFTK